MILAGSGAGGGSRINWGACIRTPAAVRREWAEQHGLGFVAGEQFDDALDAVESRLGVSKDAQTERSFNGSVLRDGLQVCCLMWPVLTTFVTARQSLPDHNRACNEAISSVACHCQALERNTAVRHTTCNQVMRQCRQRAMRHRQCHTTARHPTVAVRTAPSAARQGASKTLRARG